MAHQNKIISPTHPENELPQDKSSDLANLYTHTAPDTLHPLGTARVLASLTRYDTKFIMKENLPFKVDSKRYRCIQTSLTSHLHWNISRYGLSGTWGSWDWILELGMNYSGKGSLSDI